MRQKIWRFCKRSCLSKKHRREKKAILEKAVKYRKKFCPFSSCLVRKFS